VSQSAPQQRRSALAGCSSWTGKSGGPSWARPARAAACRPTCIEPRGLFREDRPDFLGPVYFVDFGNGNDSNNGHGVATAWKTFSSAFGASAVTHGARVMLSAGTSIESGVASIDYAANSIAGHRHHGRVQISGQGRDARSCGCSLQARMAGAAHRRRLGYRKLSDAHSGPTPHGAPDVFRQRDATAGKPKWTFRDARRAT
jgi:hypothetical protein